MPLPKTIDEVVDRLEEILKVELQSNRYTALFTYIYMITTLAVKDGIDKQIFADNERMEDFDVRFANLYIQAYEDYGVSNQVSKSWQRAFDVGTNRLTIIQHILLGMNAHINLDLAVAAAETCPGAEIFSLEADFQKINSILFSLTKQPQRKIGRVSPMFFLLDNLITDADEKIINFSMKQARSQSWRNAVLLAHADPLLQPMLISEIDVAVAALAKRIEKPKSFFFRKTLQLVAKTEETNLKKILDRLYE